MSLREILKEVQGIQASFLEFVEKQIDNEEHLQIFTDFFENHQISDNYFLLILKMIAHISNFHYRNKDFILKIEQILQFFKDQIKKCSNQTIFDIFKYSKRIILFLIKENMLNFDEKIVKQLMKITFRKMCYPQYFFPEIKPFLSQKTYLLESDDFHSSNDINDLEYEHTMAKMSKELPEDFEEKRKIGENDNYLCQLIRNDSIEEFLNYIKQNNISLSSKVSHSIYETNSFLLFHDYFEENTYEIKEIQPYLIEYAAFFGSTQIFKYLLLNVKNGSNSLWKYAVHSDNTEIIHLLEDSKIEFSDDAYIKSIEFHSNNVANYMKDKFKMEDFLSEKLKNYHFLLIDENVFLQKSTLFKLCEINQSFFVEKFIEEKQIDINNFRLKQSECELSFIHINIEKRNLPIIKLLVSNEQININVLSTIKREDKSGLRNPEYEWDDWLDWGNFSDCYWVSITPLLYAIDIEDIDIVNLLLGSKNIDINLSCEFSRNYGNNNEDRAEITALYYAVKKENIEIINSLLAKEDLDINQDVTFKYGFNDENGKTKIEVHRSPLHLAIEKGNVEIVKLLLKSKKIDINCIKSFEDFGNEFEELSIRNESSKRTPLHIAVTKNNIEIIKLLLSNDELKINEFQIIKKSDLFYDEIEVWLKNPNSCKVSSKDNVNSFENEMESKSVLHIAIQNGNPEIVELLLSNKKIDVNLHSELFRQTYELDYMKDEEILQKNTGLHIAIEKNNVEVIKLLLFNEKINVNLPSLLTLSNCKLDDEKELNGRDVESFPLHFAVEKGNIEIIKLLMSNKNINVNLKNKNGEKPIDLTTNIKIKKLFNE